MSSSLDRSQPTSFYFGLAIRDLADKMPPDDSSFLPHVEKNFSLSEKVEELLALSEQVLEKQKELSFLLRDVKRFI